MLKEVKQLPDYPSASGIEYLNKKYYIIGDDANNLLITDDTLTAIDSIPLYSFSEKKIPKTVKADLEAITLVDDDSIQKLLLIGSGSSAPYRNAGWLINPLTKQTDSIRLDTFYQRIKNQGLDEINIEGICSVPGGILLSNRGNKNYRKNFLIFTKKAFWKKQSDVIIKLIPVGSNTDTALFNGISGIAYVSTTDQLILTVSTENTGNNIDDGAIGKSYLWIIDDFSAKKNWAAINPDKIIDLEKKDSRFKNQKIESVCVTSVEDGLIQLVLAADNDNESSTLFRIEIKQN